MRAVVEFGKPQTALDNKSFPCGVSGQYVCESVAKADKLAKELLFVFGEGRVNPASFKVSADKPRITYWTNDRTFWITVSLLDGTPRGAYASTVK